MKYKINIQETVSEEFEIEANSEEEALRKAQELYKRGEIVLEPGNILSVDFMYRCSFSNLGD